MSDLAIRPAPDGEEQPRVQYGWYLKGSEGRFPLWAYSIPELDEAERERSDLQMLLWPPDAEIHTRLRAKFARLRAELQDQIAAQGVVASPRKAADRRPAGSRVIAMPQPAMAASGHPNAAEESTPPQTRHVAYADAFEVPVQLASLGEEIRALLGEVQQLGERHVPDPPSDKVVAETPAPEVIHFRFPLKDAEPGPAVCCDMAEPGAVAVPPRSEPAVLCDVAELDAVAVPSCSEPAELCDLAQSDAVVVPPSFEPAALCDVAEPDAVAVPPCSEFSSARITAKSVRRWKFARLLRSNDPHRSRRPCPTCGGETHYIPNFSTVFSGLYLRACKSCSFQEARHVKIQTLDDRDPEFVTRRPYRRAVKRSRPARHLAIWVKKFRRCILH